MVHRQVARHLLSDGPWIATADQVDVANLDIRCWVNGELRQDANTSDLMTSLGQRGHA